MKKKHKWSTFILLSIFFIGLSVMLYPAISNYWNSKTQSKAIVDYEKMLESIPEADYTKLFAEADEYNRKLAELKHPLIEFGKIDGYFDTLNLTGTGMMGYVTIEKINVELPLYHGTDDDVLSVAVGHIQGTSLPVGGNTTHSVVSAHRGLPSATLFTNLDKMELGDTFKITVLDRIFTYQVDSIKTIDPTNVSDLAIEENEDYCTLLTCTPYGINTHRLIVRGKRIETIEQKTIYIKSDAYQIDSLIVTPIVALPILFTLMMIVLFKPVKKEKSGDDLD
ncbi:MAG: class C sortase [Ruminococcaceae bacterium]|nr:class C sortase [Oscillospiraceae bacterium]